MIDISVIVPAYNAERHIGECLKSIINQSFRNIEIIIVNDGSTDNTRCVIEDFQKIDDRIISIYQKNSGPGEARNSGVKISKGKYLGFVDADDSIKEDMFFKMFNKAEKNCCDIVSCNYINKYSDSTFSNKLYLINKSQVYLNEFGIGNFIIEDVLLYRFGGEVWSKLIRAQIVKENAIVFRSYKEILGEDILFLLECLLVANKICYIDEPLYEHSILKNSLTNSNIPLMSDRLMNLIDTYIGIAKLKKQYDEIEDAIPLMVYSYVSNSIAYEKGIRNKYTVLRRISSSETFINSMEKLSNDRNVSVIKRMFAFLCKKKYFYFAAIYRRLIECGVKVKNHRSR